MKAPNKDKSPKEIVANLRDKGTDVLRKEIMAIVGFRLRLLDIKKQLEGAQPTMDTPFLPPSDDKIGPDLELAFEEIDKAIDCLYEAESSIGNAHQHILVGTTTFINKAPFDLDVPFV